MTFPYFLVAILILVTIFLLRKIRADWREMDSLKYEINRVQSDFDLFKRKENKDRKDLLEKLGLINNSFKVLSDEKAELSKNNDSLLDEMIRLNKFNSEIEEKFNSISNDYMALSSREEELKRNYRALSSNFSELTIKHFDLIKKSKTTDSENKKPVPQLIETQLNLNPIYENFEELKLRYSQSLRVQRDLGSKCSELSLKYETLKAQYLELDSEIKNKNILSSSSYSLTVCEKEELQKKYDMVLNDFEELKVSFFGLKDKFNSVTGAYNSMEYKEAELRKVYEPLLKKYDDLKVRNLELENHVKTLDDLEIIKRNLEVFEVEHELVAAGLYPLYVPYETPDELNNQLEEKRTKLADMIRSKTAAICNTKWTINGSTAEGTKATKHYIRIMLRTFNADADSCLAMVRWNNFEKCVARINASFEYVNKLGESHSTQIQSDYLQLRVEQLELMYRYKEALHQHKESMREARAAAVEERRAQKELENARKSAEQEEIHYTRALERARSELQSLMGAEHSNMLQRIEELESELSKAVELKKRAISMAQITKAGFVYVVSNIGSFGPNVLKIGMTRRIDPKDRIRELGGASVPFGFDVHAMIYSEDAPNLESRFHRHFSRCRINLANGRKEFFRATLSDVVKFAETLSLKAEFISEIEAKDFRLSDELRRTVLTKLTDDELQARIEASVTNLPDEDELEDDAD